MSHFGETRAEHRAIANALCQLKMNAIIAATSRFCFVRPAAAAGRAQTNDIDITGLFKPDEMRHTDAANETSFIFCVPFIRKAREMRRQGG